MQDCLQKGERSISAPLASLVPLPSLTCTFLCYCVLYQFISLGSPPRSPDCFFWVFVFFSFLKSSLLYTSSVISPPADSWRRMPGWLMTGHTIRAGLGIAGTQRDCAFYPASAPAALPGVSLLIPLHWGPALCRPPPAGN